MNAGLRRWRSRPTNFTILEDKEKESLIDEKIIRIHFCCFYKRQYVGSGSRFQILMIISELVKTFVARAWLKLVSMLLS
jgi:hypothetical protein